MTHEQFALWHRIRDFQIDAPQASFPYSTRLAREKGWTPAYAARVIDEYRKFAFLSVVAGHGVTPSKDVDEAWHLHLLYTRNYWDEFCPKALGRHLHHNPSDGNIEDEQKFEGWYEKTLASYERIFEEAPPADIWLREKAPQRSSRRWLPFLGLFATMLTGCEEPINPLDWHGPAFLQLFFTLYLVAVGAAFLVRRHFLGTSNGPPADEWQLHTYEKAYLNEGPGLALATAIAHLTTQNILEVDKKSRRIRAIGTVHETTHPLERVIVRAASSAKGARYEEIHGRARSALSEMESTLRRQGLWANDEGYPGTVGLPLLVASLPLLLGIAKIFVGIDRGRPVGFLIAGCVVGGLLNLLFLSPPKRTPYGDRILEELRQGRSDRLVPQADATNIALGMALFGMTTLDQGEYAYLRPALRPEAAYGGDSGGGSDSGGSSCSSSGCGGGGGCGGGCGGCGS